MKNNFILVENVLNVWDDNRLWFYIPGFNGYEVSNDGFLRSMKHYKRYHFGILIQPKKNRKGQIINPEDPMYELSNNDNERVNLRLSQIQYLARTNNRQITGYPRKTYISDSNPRNSRIFIKKDINHNKELFFPKFNIIHENELEDNRKTVVCPIEIIK